MGFLNKIFQRKKPALTFEEQVNNEIYNCEQAIFSYQKDIHNIRKLAADLIHKTLIVPKKYWYEELKYLDDILNLPKNKKIDQNILQDIRNISQTYKKQLELKNLKINVCEKSRDELRQMLEQETSLRRKIENELNPENIIEKHKELSKAISDTNISIELSTNEKVKLMKEKITSLRNDLLEKKEFNKQLQILYSKYGNSSESGTVKVYLEELKKLIQT